VSPIPETLEGEVLICARREREGMFTVVHGKGGWEGTDLARNEFGFEVGQLAPAQGS
jgi:hypothetical protein